MNKFLKNTVIIAAATVGTTVAIDLLSNKPVGTTAKGMATGAVDCVKGMFSKGAEVAETAADAVADAAAEVTG